MQLETIEVPNRPVSIVLGIEQNVQGTNNESYSFCDATRKGYLYGCAEVTAKTKAEPKPVIDLEKVFANDPIATVNFDFDSSLLTTNALAVLDSLDLTLIENKQLVLRGYTDSIGAKEYNENLARRRSQAVEDYLKNILSLPNDTQALGFGLCCYVAPNTTDSNREENRRVEIYLN